MEVVQRCVREFRRDAVSSTTRTVYRSLEKVVCGMKHKDKMAQE